MKTLSLTCIGTNVHHTLAMLLGVQLHLYFSKWLSLTRLQMNYSTKRASSKFPQGNSATDINQTTKLPPPSPSSRHTHVRVRACTHVHPWAHILTQTHTGAKKRACARAHTHTHARTHRDGEWSYLSPVNGLLQTALPLQGLQPDAVPAALQVQGHQW